MRGRASGAVRSLAEPRSQGTRIKNGGDEREVSKKQAIKGTSFTELMMRVSHHRFMDRGRDVIDQICHWIIG